MSIELLMSISTQKAHKTCYKQGSILHYFGTNHWLIGYCKLAVYSRLNVTVGGTDRPVRQTGQPVRPFQRISRPFI